MSLKEQKYSALVLGSTGLIGGQLIEILLKNDKYSIVFAISRKPLNINHPKLILIQADHSTIKDKLSNISVQIDHFFCCIGSTKSKTPNLQEYYTIDHDYPLDVISSIKEKGCNQILLVSSIGANASSNNFYLKLKGEIEEDVKKTNIKSIHIFRPSILLGDRTEYRFGEIVAKILAPIFNIFLFGKYRNYKSIKSSDVASAMVNIAEQQISGIHTYQSEEIKQLA